jgi:hypothetical protein
MNPGIIKICSLAILLKDAGHNNWVTIYATDFNEAALIFRAVGTHKWV